MVVEEQLENVSANIKKITRYLLTRDT
jgi:hypothetical protein